MGQMQPTVCFHTTGQNDCYILELLSEYLLYLMLFLDPLKPKIIIVLPFQKNLADLNLVQNQWPTLCAFSICFTDKEIDREVM